MIQKNFNKPLISVILTTFNGQSRGYLEYAIESVLAQTFDNFELVLIDDGSTDDTKGICEKYLRNEKVFYFFQPNKGLASARNIGISKSNGIYICFIDDDVWKKDKLQKQISFLTNILMLEWYIRL